MLNRLIGIWVCWLALGLPSIAAPVSPAEMTAADIPRLLELYRGIPPDETGQQLKVIDAIVRRGGKEAEDALCRLLPLTHHQFMQDNILNRLASFRSPSAKMALAAMAASPLRESALQALFHVAGPEDDAPCRRVLELTPEQRPPVIILQLLARCRYRPAEAYVLRLINDRDVILQSAAIEALGGVGGPESLPVLLEIVRARQPAWQHHYYRSKAARALGQTGGMDEAAVLDTLIEELQPLLANPDKGDCLLVRDLVEARTAIILRHAKQPLGEVAVREQWVTRGEAHLRLTPPPNTVATRVTIISEGQVKAGGIVTGEKLDLALPAGRYTLELRAIGYYASISPFDGKLYSLRSPDKVLQVSSAARRIDVTVPEGGVQQIVIRQSLPPVSLHDCLTAFAKEANPPNITPLLLITGVLRDEYGQHGDDAPDCLPYLPTSPISRTWTKVFDGQGYIFAELIHAGTPPGLNAMLCQVCRRWDNTYVLLIIG